MKIAILIKQTLLFIIFNECCCEKTYDIMIIFSNHWFQELVAMTTSETTESFRQLRITELQIQIQIYKLRITELQIQEDSALTTL